MTVPSVLRKRSEFVGYADGPVDGVNCERPKRLLTPGDEIVFSRCRKSDGSCEPCASTYRRNVGRVARSGTLMPGRTYFLTLTAPGDRAHNIRPGVRCECTPPGGVDLRRWNGQAVDRWNDLSRALARAWGVERFEYFKAVEVQKRGALHLHVLIRVDRPVRLSLGKLRALAVHHGYGHAVDWQELDPADPRAASYCAKYVSKSSAERSQVPYVHRLTGEIGRGRWRTWTASRQWGQTMSSLRAEQAAWMREQVDLAECGQADAAGGGAAADGAAGRLDPYRERYASARPDSPAMGGVRLV